MVKRSVDGKMILRRRFGLGKKPVSPISTVPAVSQVKHGADAKIKCDVFP